MGVYIKGMDMPLQCYDCYFVASDPDTKKLYCKPLNRDVENLSDKFADCPLVEVKAQHGRLIDAEKLSRMWFTTSLDNEDTKEWVQAFQDSIKFSRTVIEAEGKDDG